MNEQVWELRAVQGYAHLVSYRIEPAGNVNLSPHHPARVMARAGKIAVFGTLIGATAIGASIVWQKPLLLLLAAIVFAVSATFLGGAKKIRGVESHELAKPRIRSN